MTESFLKPEDFINFAMDHSGTLARHPHQLNPYLLGFTLLHDIEDRWNKGQFGREWDECTSRNEKLAWDKKLGLGREKIFECRLIENDYSLVDKYLTEDFCDKHKLDKMSADELCASVEYDEYPHLDEDTKKAVIIWLKSFVTVWDIITRTDIVEKLQTETI